MQNCLGNFLFLNIRSFFFTDDGLHTVDDDICDSLIDSRFIKFGDNSRKYHVNYHIWSYSSNENEWNGIELSMFRYKNWNRWTAF